MNLLSKIPRDKRVHLVGGTLLAAGTAATLLLGEYVGPGAAIAAASVVMGWGIERYQAIRREGAASKWDWAATSAPGVLLGAAVELALRIA